MTSSGRLLVVGVVALLLPIACGGDDQTPIEDDEGATTVGGQAGATASQGGFGGMGGELPEVGGAGGAGGTAMGGMGGSCADTTPGEPNEVELDAYRLADIDCADSSGGSVYGVLGDPSEADWFVYKGTDKFNCVVNPVQGLSSTSGDLRLCAFVECLSTNTELGSCSAGSTPATSPNGRAGCCATGAEVSFELLDVNCTNTTNETVNIYFRVDSPGQSAECIEYTLDYHY